MTRIASLGEKPSLTLIGDVNLAPKMLAYLATPYTNYPDGIEIAFREASRLAAELLKLSIEIYSPIAHCHPLAIFGDIDALDRAFWLQFQENMMGRCDVLIIAEMKSWKESHGIAHEIQFFKNVRKPIFQLNIGEMTLRRFESTVDPFFSHDKIPSEHAESSA